MSIENTGTGQQPNPGDDGNTPSEAAIPNADTGIDPNLSEGQGEGGGKTGDAAGTEATTPGDGQDGKPNKDADAGVPEAYADFTLPDGFVLDGERKEASVALFRDLGLSQEKAQQAIDHFIKTVGEDEATRAQALEAAVTAQRDDWGKQAKAELGDKYDAEVAMARTAVAAVDSPALVKAFDELGWGNHPELIKTFALFGRMMRDSPVDGIGNSGASTPAAKPWDRMYPDMT